MRKLYLALSITLLLSMTACVADKSTPQKETDKKESTQTVALTEQLAEGKEIHTDSCTKCHDTSVYTKKDRKIQTLETLKKRVKACNTNTGAGLEKEELEALTLFLNTSYYKFKK